LHASGNVPILAIFVTLSKFLVSKATKLENASLGARI